MPHNPLDLTVTEAVAVASLSRDPSSYCVVPVEAVIDGRAPVDIVTGQDMHRYIRIPLMVVLRASDMKHSAIRLADNSPADSPTNGMLPVVPGRLVIPYDRLTFGGKERVKSLRAGLELREHEGWNGVVPWCDVSPTERVLRWLHIDGRSSLAGIVTRREGEADVYEWRAFDTEGNHLGTGSIALLEASGTSPEADPFETAQSMVHDNIMEWWQSARKKLVARAPDGSSTLEPPGQPEHGH